MYMYVDVLITNVDIYIDKNSIMSEVYMQIVALECNGIEKLSRIISFKGIIVLY